MKKNPLFLIVLLLLIVSCPIHGQQINNSEWNRYSYNPSANGGRRYCNNPNCIMCNRIFGPMPGYQLTSEGRSVKSTQPILKVETKPEDQPLLEPSPIEAVKAMLEIVKPTPDQTLYDLGCGDGRILAIASKKYGCKSVGIEINPDSVIKARELIEIAGVQDKASVIEGDILKEDISDADIVTLYLFPDLLKKVAPLLPKSAVVISFSHDIPGVKTEKKTVKIDDVEYDFYVARGVRIF